MEETCMGMVGQAANEVLMLPQAPDGRSGARRAGLQLCYAWGGRTGEEGYEAWRSRGLALLAPGQGLHRQGGEGGQGGGYAAVVAGVGVMGALAECGGSL